MQREQMSRSRQCQRERHWRGCSIICSHIKRQVVAVLTIMLVSVVITLINPLIIQQAIDVYIAGEDWHGLKRAWHCGSSFEPDTCPTCENTYVYYGEGVK